MTDGPSDVELLAESNYLMSLGISPYNSLNPTVTKVKIIPSRKFFFLKLVDNSQLDIYKPTCTDTFCNKFGVCQIVDKSLTCICSNGRIGTNCQLQVEGYKSLSDNFNSLYNSIMSSITDSFTDDQLQSIWNLFYSASSFYQDTTFFSSTFDSFMNFITKNYPSSIKDNTALYFNLYDFYFNYETTRLNQAKAKLLADTNGRNSTLDSTRTKEFASSFDYITSNIEGLINLLIQNYGLTPATFRYDSDNFYIAFGMLTPTFNETTFFSDRSSNYRSWVTFMNCINHIEITKLNNPYYQAWFVFIEYVTSPFAYNSTFYTNNVSPMTTLYFIDADTNKIINVNDCDTTAITFYQPFNSLKYIDSLNSQISFYDPNNYKGWDDPIFSTLIYINETSGAVSNDTRDSRIATYQRKYNISCTYYNPANSSYLTSNVSYVNFTNNYIVFNTTHLTSFTTFFVPNNISYPQDGRFFYLKYLSIFKNSDNYLTNSAFFVFLILLIYYTLAVFITTCYDLKYFRQEALLEFLRAEIYKVNFPYRKNKKLHFDPIFGKKEDQKEKEVMDNNDENFNDYLTKKQNANVKYNYDADLNSKDVLKLKDNNNEQNYNNFNAKKEKEADVDFDFNSQNIDDLFNFNDDGLINNKRQDNEENDIKHKNLIETGKNNLDFEDQGLVNINVNNFLAGEDKSGGFYDYRGLVESTEIKESNFIIIKI